ncbi:MAG: diaminopimelate decarboxylase [Tannerellaceae bacterium]|jgi:diaminopimelate decarboxylase|nr:diaminopimelate decarboxylase [Tannerellaceae bacterium]
MKTTIFPIERLKDIPTPFYYYDVELLQQTLANVTAEAAEGNYRIHFAVKANNNPRILGLIAQAGIGADCVSGGEIRMAIEAGIPASKIVYAGVGKDDWEIELALDQRIFCINVESAAEMKVINQIATKKNTIAPIALRINPDIDAHTHEKISTGRRGNKFGIEIGLITDALELVNECDNLRLTGIHAHIGSQITKLDVFKALAERFNDLQDVFDDEGLPLQHINLGGGLGIDYKKPENNMPDFASYFDIFRKNLEVRPQQSVHFELGRSVVAQCGTLIAKTIYVKEGETRNFAVVNAGFNDLVRPAMYGAWHHIENITSDRPAEAYDVVGPICESADIFGAERNINAIARGDLIAIRSAGAYGEVMASQYNGRPLPKAYFSDSL